MTKSLVRLLLCLLSALSVAAIDYGLPEFDSFCLNCLCFWLAIWLYFELFPLEPEQYSWRMLSGILKYGPLALFLLFWLVVACEALYDKVNPPVYDYSVAIAYT